MIFYDECGELHPKQLEMIDAIMKGKKISAVTFRRTKPQPNYFYKLLKAHSKEANLDKENTK